MQKTGAVVAYQADKSLPASDLGRWKGCPPPNGIHFSHECSGNLARTYKRPKDLDFSCSSGGFFSDFLAYTAGFAAKA
jgi:hypothetical protein